MALLSWTPESIKERIKIQNHFIESAVSLIPPKNYFKNSDDNEIYYNKRKRVSKQLLKEQKKAAKKQKLDPNNLKTNIKSKPKDEEHNSSKTRLTITERLSRLRLAKQNFEQDSEKKKKIRKEKNRIREENKKKRSKNLNQQKELNDNDSKGKEDINLNSKPLEQENIQIQDSNSVEGNATQLHEKEEWRKALQKTQGEKVKDDISLLKKTIKNKTFKKKSSEKAWKERLQAVSKAITEKQEKRTKNIQERINMKKNKKGRKHK
ncbi:6257_t:CDS:2 [Diversispora eburnea]|uniref:6257_t:CDS:1 n=1 Tax=Diversispora eburnea TaxID=1213867 RepID=A0A9N9A9S0_9GLOM|nr:6257_t:CDS:2 [Diversispora eburnea]